MRALIKKMLHGGIRIVEHTQGFYLPADLPAKTKWEFLIGTYELETAEYLRKNVRGGVAIDVGAHVGFFARLLAPLVETVYAFEPDPTNFAFLVKNTKRYANIVPVNVAVSDGEGEQAFFRVPHSTFRHSLIDEGDCEKIMVHTTTLDAYMAGKPGKVSCVKIDVEGHEQSVLRGMQGVIIRDHPLVIAEMPENDRYESVSGNIGSKRQVRNYRIV